MVRTPTPAPSLRELLSAAKLRECPSLLVTSQKFQSLYALVCKALARRNHRSTLPQSRVRSTAPSEREPGRGAHHSACRPETGGVRAIFIAPTKLREFYIPPFNRVLAKPQRCGRFSSPESAESFTFHHSSGWLQNPKRAILGKMALGGVIFPESPGRWCSRRF